MADIEGHVSPGNEIVTWQDKMKAYAVKAVESEQPQGQFFSIKSGVLSFGNVPIPNNTMDVLVVGSLHENVFYEGRYNPDQPAGPVCFAFSKDGVDMQPHDMSVKKQNEVCQSCPRNKWGSDPGGGRGKACKNVRRIALMSATAVKGDDPALVSNSQVGYLRVPVTSVANYQRFIAQVGARGLPPFAVVCRVKVLPDPKSQVRVEFEALQTVNDQRLLQALLERFEIEQRLIDFPYETITDEADGRQPVSPPANVPPPAASKF
jgi:hypothetical protein